ncbi:MAG TPA: dTMP kinase [Burkholderiales bacterium]|nr:dTMP kinase [Burkholderiales bacterium]
MTGGRFITFEGVDGAGKSTHLAWSAEWFRGRGYIITVTREPGGTPLGEKLRNLLLHGEPMLQPETEALLMFAARKEHLERVIRPALDRGEIVLCDRFTDASFAYQGGGRGVPFDRLRELEEWIQAGFQPHLTLYFDLPVEAARARIAGLKTLDRFEREDPRFFERVRAAYLRRVKEAPNRIVVIDAGQSIAAVQAELERQLLRLCQP